MENPISLRWLCALVLAAVPAAAQSTGTPVFHAPYRAYERQEFGGSVSDYGNLAIEGFFSFGRPGRRWDLSLRGGLADFGGGRRAVLLLGVDARYRLISQTVDFPLDGSLVTGVGVNLASGGSSLGIPIGLSVGRRVRFTNSNMSLVPYAEPLIFPRFGNHDTRVAVALGLGADLRISQRFELRGGIGLGDIQTISISAALVR